MFDYEPEHADEFVKDHVEPNWEWIQKEFPNLGLNQQEFAKILAMGWEMKRQWDITVCDPRWD